MMRIFIIDDETPARERLRTLLADIAVQCPNEVVGEADSARDAVRLMEAAAPDLVLLDIRMPGLSGIDLAPAIAGMAHPPAIVFVTAYDQYALKAFDVDAVDYLLKPVRGVRLLEALQRVQRLRVRQRALEEAAQSASSEKRQHFSVMERGRIVLVPVQDVIYLKAEQKYVTLHTKVRDYLVEEPLISIEIEWPDVFVRVHRNALVAKNAIVGVERSSQAVELDGSEKVQESWEVMLKDTADRLPISRRQWPAVKALIR